MNVRPTHYRHSPPLDKQCACRQITSAQSANFRKRYDWMALPRTGNPPYGPPTPTRILSRRPPTGLIRLIIRHVLRLICTLPTMEFPRDRNYPSLRLAIGMTCLLACLHTYPEWARWMLSYREVIGASLLSSHETPLLKKVPTSKLPVSAQPRCRSIG